VGDVCLPREACFSWSLRYAGLRYHRFVPSYYVANFGCRATQADGAALERQFEQQGLDRAANAAKAAVVVLNTCTVTAAADQDARAAIRRLRRQNPEAKIVVTGCYAQRAPEEIAALPGVSLVVGNSHKHQLAEIARGQFGSDHQVPAGAWLPLDALTSSGARPTTESEPSFTSGIFSPEIFVSDIFAHTELMAAPVFDAANERTRPNLKIQDGCDNRCSFCVIPYVRGQSRSLGVERIIGEVNALVGVGYREVVISGINLGRWGRDLGETKSDQMTSPEARDQGSEARGASYVFEDLIRAILAETSLEKLRISSVEPMDWSDELICLAAESPRIAKHAHVPMQSGSDSVLRRMHRKYRPWHYREKIEKIRAAMPTAAIGADVMVGFPGESDAEFEETRRMIEGLPFTYLHVFTYSARPGTPAAAMPNQVPVQIARKRNRVLRELASEKKLAFMRGFVGNEIEAITLGAQGIAGEGARTTLFNEALTDNYLKLRLEGCHESNRWLRAQVLDVIDGVLVGRVLTSAQSTRGIC
jgi:threonylcarbamoyladenosine tRNA methylthiotransferase MtaB